MSQTTSSRKSYNRLALMGNGIDDMEYIDDWNNSTNAERYGSLDPSIAYTPKFNEDILNKVMQQEIAEGVDPEVAKRNHSQSQREIKELLAMNGMLK